MKFFVRSALGNEKLLNQFQFDDDDEKIILTVGLYGSIW